MKTILSHFYNEEYLLPWWLSHHKKYFDHGIMINYNSTDKSTEIIKKICPTWQIIDSENSYFDALSIDKEIEKIESKLQGWRIVLNTTEFLLGNYNLLENEPNEDILIRSYLMVDNPNDEFNHPDYDKDLILQRYHGINSDHIVNFRMLRRLSKVGKPYPTGRHFSGQYSNNFVILWYGFSPMTDEFLKRKIQIQKNIPESNIKLRLGIHHITNIDDQMRQFREWQPQTKNLLNHYMDLIKD
jgi:hypothetical protein